MYIVGLNLQKRFAETPRIVFKTHINLGKTWVPNGVERVHDLLNAGQMLYWLSNKDSEGS